jgi:hypothetical protein
LTGGVAHDAAMIASNSASSSSGSEQISSMKASSVASIESHP